MVESKSRLLIVDDSPDDVDFYRRLLVTGGANSFILSSVATGREGLWRCREERPHIVLLDYSLPDMSGLDFIRALKGGDQSLSMSLVVSTGEGDEQIAVNAMKLGAMDYVIKDELTSERLLETLTNALHRFQALEREAWERQVKKMETIGQLTGGIAHDFNNLLTVILGNLQFIQLELGDQQGEVIKGLIEDALAAVHDGADLTKRLLAFSRRQPLRTERVELDVVLNNLMRIIRRTTPENINLTLRISAVTPPVLVDKNLLENALLNLVINAQQAMPRGGQLQLETDLIVADGQLPTSELKTGRYALIKVTDNGVGMSPETLARACDPFFTTKPQGHGSGLGLSTVQGFVKQSGGDITITSRPQKGTEVRLYLPTAVETGESEEKSANVVPVAMRLQGGAEQVLVVEDRIDVLNFVTRALRQLGYRVESAVNAQEAIHYLQEKPFDLVVSDVIMPGPMNGWDLARWLQMHHPYTQILLTTGFNEEELKSSGSLPRDLDILRKPYTLAQLAAAVRHCLEHSSPRLRVINGGKP